MTNNRIMALMGGVALATSATVAAQGGDAEKERDFARAYPNVNAVKLYQFTGAVEIAVGGDETAIILSDGAKRKPVEIKDVDGVLTISSEESYRDVNRIRELSWSRGGRDALEDYLEDFPTLKISVPKGADVTLFKTVATAIAGDGLGAVSIEKGLVEANFGDVREASIGISHSANVALGSVSEDLEVRIGGSGNFDATSAGAATLIIGGSGNINLGPVTADAGVKIGGSGNVYLGDVAGDIDVRVGGSGDVKAKSARNGGEFSIAGSGNIVVDAIEGPTRATIAGSGSVNLLSGTAQDLYVSIAGNGRFEFDGVSTNLTASITGSGVIDVKKNTGTLKTSGTGGVVRVNGQKIDLRKRHSR